ncbi:MAG TPA: DUF2637 domain-containing protein [Actinocrinis sp.]|uniref:DUF2637 domain-containing protein n=1 Tax=Actinocrinis sp. TaxID=1920516 RepID=UPI002DDDB994|nr:DUF2637 domain-containing protein [Actinocrinis sp.]HEV2344507.1 DUF2637 domain-containing protein [Actinocrinis sp.]
MLDLAPPGERPSLALVNGHAFPPQSSEPIQEAPGPLGAGWITVVIVVGIMAALIALGGMVLSFRAVSGEMVPAFGARWAWLVPIVVDLTVFVFSGVDLVLARLDMGHPLARWTVYGATAGTVWLNYSAGGSAAGRTAHVLMPSIWVVFIELMRHVVRRQTNLATGSVREPIPAARWLVSPWPTLKLWRRMILWRQHSYTAALVMERARLGAIAVAKQMRPHGWRRALGPLMRLQINLGEADAAAVAAALTLAAERPLTGHAPGQNPATDAASERPESGHDDGQNAAKPRPTKRPRSGRDTAGKVAKVTAKHPEWSAAQVAASLGIGERTARRYMTGH